MGYSYTPTYYSSLHDTITSLCKSFLPFRRRLTHPLHKRQSDHLKWQQESFHRILHLSALNREGIIPDSDVSAFRTQLLDTLIAAPSHPEPPALLRDKLLFLQELLYANCISQAEYHSSKRPLLQRLAVQGVEIDSRDLVIAGGLPEAKPSDDEEWSVIDLRDKETAATPPSKKDKHRSPFTVLFGNKQKSQVNATEPPRDSCSVLMKESSKDESVGKDGNSKKKALHALFSKEQGNGGGKKHWGIEGLRKWRRGGCDSEVAASAAGNSLERERSDDVVTCELVARPVGEGPDTKKIKTKLHRDGNSSDFFIDKVLGDNIKKELTRIQTELGNPNKSLSLSEEQMEAISTKLPADKGDLNEYFPKSWCDRHGEVVLDVVRKEFKDHVGDMGERRNATMERRQNNSRRWVAFEDDEENQHPNLFGTATSSSFSRNPFSEASKNPFVASPPRNPFLEDHLNPFFSSQPQGFSS